MTRIARPWQAIMLAITLVLTAQSMAAARGQAVAVGEMVICTGAGVMSLPVDAEGNPTGPPHVCPDCTLSLFVAEGAPMPALWRGLVLSAIEFPQRPAAVSEGLAAGLPLAREPPAGG
ncbi:MAG: hypothetical protein ACLFRU_06615 [Paracoccaceae bacterium]